MAEIDIYHGDCLEILPDLDREVDIVYTNIPGVVNKEHEFIARIDLPRLRELLDALEPRWYVFEAHNFGGVKHLLDLAKYNTYTRYVWIEDRRRDLIFESDRDMRNFEITVSEMYRGWVPKIHSSQTPVELMVQIFSQISESGDTILDPCMGGGSTGVAAHELGLDFIGIEIKEDIFTKAKARLDDL